MKNKMTYRGAIPIVVALLLAGTSVFATQIIQMSEQDGGNFIQPISDPSGNVLDFSAPTVAYSQNFDTYLGTAATVPFGWSVSFSGTPTFNGVGTGTSSTGGAWAYGTGGENSFGALRSGTAGNLTLAVAFVNDTGATITDLTISWNYEQWRYGTFNTSGFNLSGTGALAGNATVDAADFSGSATGTNGVSTSTPITLTLSGLSIASGATYGLSWVTTDLTNSDNGVAIDDFMISAGAVVPEPTILAMMLLGGSLLVGVQRFRRRAH